MRGRGFPVSCAMYLMKAVLNPPPAMRILRVAAEARAVGSRSAGDSAFTVENGRWPAPRATEPTAERTTKSLRFMWSSRCRTCRGRFGEHATRRHAGQRASDGDRPGGVCSLAPGLWRRRRLQWMIDQRTRHSLPWSSDDRTHGLAPPSPEDAW